MGTNCGSEAELAAGTGTCIGEPGAEGRQVGSAS